MYRQFLKTYIETDRLREINRNCPENVKFCNFICQDFRNKDEFSGLNTHTFCNKCRNILNLAEKQISDKKITVEQFKENPQIVNGIDIVLDTLKECVTCKQKKTIDQYDTKKNECKACRAIKTKERNEKDIDILISDVTKLKDNLDALERFVTDIPKDRLVKVISHFKIGRKATDTKAKMIWNVKEHFRSLLNPFICKGGCGYTLQTEFSTCNDCDKKNEKPTAIEKMVEFDENLVYIVENLEEITEDKMSLYNREQYYKIANCLGLKVQQKTKKDEVVIMINNALMKREQERKALKEEDEKTCHMELNGIMVTARHDDGYINATSLCKAGGKKFNDWYKTDIAKNLIETLKKDLQISDDLKLVDIKKGGNPKNQGTWLHPDLGVPLAQWISSDFAIRVSRWMRQLYITGSVSLTDQKTNKELLELQNKYAEIDTAYKNLDKKHKSLLYKREYYRFKKGPSFYIIRETDNMYKVGIEGIDVNERFRTERTTCPKLEVLFLAYTPKALLIETCMLSRYETKKLALNHEVIVDTTDAELIDGAKTIINFLNIKVNIESFEELKKYNDTL